MSRCYPRSKSRLASCALALAYHFLLIRTEQVPKANNRSLDGLKLRCCALLESPITIADTSSERTGGVSGLAIEYLLLLQEKTGFRCESFEVYRPSSAEFVEFSGFVRYLDSCVTVDGDYSACTCQLGVAGFVRNPERNRKVQFVSPFAFGAMGVVENVSTMENGSMPWFFVFKPLDPIIWGFIAISVFLFVFVRVVLEQCLRMPAAGVTQWGTMKETFLKLRGYLDRRRMQRALNTLASDFLLTMSSFIGTSTAPENPTPSDDLESQAGPEENTPPLQSAPYRRKYLLRKQLLNLLAAFVGLFYIIIYEAALVVILFDRKPTSRFESLVDLTHCKIDATKVCLASGGATEVFWDKTIQKARTNCRRKKLEHDQPIRIAPKNGTDPYTLGVESVADPENRCEYFIGSKSLIEVAAGTRYCGIIAVAGEEFYPISYSFVTPRQANFTEAMSDATLELQQRNKIDSAVEYGTKGRKCKWSGNSRSIDSGILPVFYLLFAILAAFLLFNIVMR